MISVNTHSYAVSNLKMKLTAVMAALVLAGCASVGPDYQAQDLQLNQYAYLKVEGQVEGQVEESATAKQLTEQLVQQDWWQQFGDEQLAQIIALANEHNPGLAVAQANLKQAMAIFDDVQDNDLPLGSAEANYSAQGQVFPGAPGQNSGRVNFHSRQLGLSAGWQLDIVGKFARAEEAANADAEAAFYAWQEPD